ncbi:condensation domain-containing protein [Actinophytocola sp.]|uniref:condensation domain-containing protein n=1 Tax=Actinophytocola sp. TaxID=1872138 RepID=UPI00389A9D1F
MRPEMTLPATARTGVHELTVGQEALWFMQRLAPESSAYNVSGALNLHFAVDVELLTSAVQRAVSRHSMLNCLFQLAGQEVRRRSGAAIGADPVLNLHNVAENDREVGELAATVARRPFRLDREPPIRVALVRRKNDPDVLLVVAHHIVADNISQVLVLREILDEYAALSAGTTHTSEDTGEGFDEFVRRQRKFLSSHRAAAARDHWRDELAGLPDSGGPPTDRPRPPTYRFTGAEVDFMLPPDVFAGAGEAAAAEGSSLFVYLFAVFQLLLHRFSGQTDLLVGYPVTMRLNRRFQNAIGYFVNLLPQRVRIEQDDSFGTVLHRTAGKTWRGLLHREYPYPLMPRLIDARPDPSRAGLIETMFVMTGGPANDSLSAPVLPGRRDTYAGLTVSEFYLPQQQGQFDLTLQVLWHGSAARALMKYNTSLFTADTAHGLAREYLDLLRSAIRGRI